MPSQSFASIRGRIGAHRLHALYDARETTASARQASTAKLNDRLLSEIDPGSALSPAAREQRLKHARSAHFSQLALKSAKKRRKAGSDAR